MNGAPLPGGPDAETLLLTCADAWVSNPDGAAQEAGGLAQVTGGDVGNVVVATEFLTRAGRNRAGRSTTHYAMSTASLIHKARMGARAHYVSAGLCRPRERAGQEPDHHLLSVSPATLRKPHS